MKAHLITLAACTMLPACAFNSEVQKLDPITYQIISVESDAGGSLNALDWETEHQGSQLCENGYLQLNQHKIRKGTDTTWFTTIRCLP